MTQWRKGLWLLCGVVVTLVCAPRALAMGKKPPSDPDAPACTAPSGYSVPNPVRAVYVAPISDVSVFKLPNQVVTDLHAQLGDMALVAMSPPNTQFQARAGSYLDGPDGESVLIRPVFTNFTLQAVEAKVSFGWTPSGAVSVGSGVTVGATGTVRVGSIRIAFEAWTCTKKGAEHGCQLAYSTESDQRVVGSDVTFGVTWSQLTLGGDILTRTDLGEVIRKIMLDGLRKLSVHPASAQLPWRGQVTGLAPEPRTYWISAGAAQWIGAWQSFELWEPVAGDFEQLSACGHSTADVFSTSAKVQVDRYLDPSAEGRLGRGAVVKVGNGHCN
jgi:hypothetical protein